MSLYKYWSYHNENLSQASNISLIALFVLMLVLNFQEILAMIGTGAIITLIVFIVGAFAIGYFLAPYSTARSVIMVHGFWLLKRQCKALL